MSLGYFLQQIVNALVSGAHYALLAAAYVLIHAITRRVNLAFAAFALSAGYMAVNTTVLLMVAMPGRVAVPLLAAAVVAIAHTVLLGLAVERVVVRRLVSAPGLAMLIATLGLGIALEEVLRLANASRDRWMPPVAWPVLALGDTAFPVRLSAVALASALMAAGLCFALVALMARHPFGRAWRACAEDHTMAALCGLDLGAVLRTTFALAAALAAASGVLSATVYGVATFHGGFTTGLKALLIAVAGGLSSPGGAMLAGLGLGLVETFWSAYLDGASRDAAVLALLCAMMAMKPEGLFARAGLMR